LIFVSYASVSKPLGIKGCASMTSSSYGVFASGFSSFLERLYFADSLDPGLSELDLFCPDLDNV